ncbi:unnamed protein product, partial [Nesidiocoris tenuis]
TIINAQAAQSVCQTSEIGTLPDGSIGIIKESITIQNEMSPVPLHTNVPGDLSPTNMQDSFSLLQTLQNSYDPSHQQNVGGLLVDQNAYSSPSDMQRSSTMLPPIGHQLNIENIQQGVSNGQMPMMQPMASDNMQLSNVQYTELHQVSTSDLVQHVTQQQDYSVDQGEMLSQSIHNEMHWQQASHPQSDLSQRQSTIQPQNYSDLQSQQTGQYSELLRQHQQQQSVEMQRISTVQAPQFSELTQQISLDQGANIQGMMQPQYSMQHQLTNESSQRVSTIQQPQYSDLASLSEGAQRQHQFSEHQLPAEVAHRQSTVQPVQFSDNCQQLPSDNMRLSTIQPPQCSESQQHVGTDFSLQVPSQPTNFSDMQRATAQPNEIHQQIHLESSQIASIHHQLQSDNSQRVSSVQPPPLQHLPPDSQRNMNVPADSAQRMSTVQAPQYSELQHQHIPNDNFHRMSSVQPPQFTELQHQPTLDGGQRVSTVQVPQYTDLQQLPSNNMQRISTVQPPSQYVDLQHHPSSNGPQIPLQSHLAEISQKTSSVHQPQYPELPKTLENSQMNVQVPQYSQQQSDTHLQLSNVQSVQYIDPPSHAPVNSSQQPAQLAEQQQRIVEATQRMSSVQQPNYAELQQCQDGLQMPIKVSQYSNQQQMSNESNQQIQMVPPSQYSNNVQQSLAGDSSHRISSVQPPQFVDLQQQRTSTVQLPHYLESSPQQVDVSHTNPSIPPQQFQGFHHSVTCDNMQGSSTLQPHQFVDSIHKSTSDNAVATLSQHETLNQISTVLPPQFSDLQKHLPTESQRSMSSVQAPKLSDLQYKLANDNVQRSLSTVQPPQFTNESFPSMGQQTQFNQAVDVNQATSAQQAITSQHPPQIVQPQQIPKQQTHQQQMNLQYDQNQQGQQLHRVSTVQPPNLSHGNVGLSYQSDQRVQVDQTSCNSDNQHRQSTVQPPQQYLLQDQPQQFGAYNIPSPMIPEYQAVSSQINTKQKTLHRTSTLDAPNVPQSTMPPTIGITMAFKC